jgi:hypothetical protein
LLERVVKLPRDTIPLAEHRLILLPLTLRRRLGPDEPDATRREKHEHHHGRVPQRPPRSSGDDDHVGRRAQEQTERWGWTPLIRVDADDRYQTAGSNRVEIRSRFRPWNPRLEDRLTSLQHEHALGGTREDAEQVGVHAHQFGVGVGRQPARNCERRWNRFGFPADDTKDRILQDWFSGSGGRKPRDFDDIARLHIRDLLGFHAGARRAVLHVQDVADIAEQPGAREVVDLDRAARNVRGDSATDANASIDLPVRGIVVHAADRSDGQRERIRRRFEHGKVACPAREERHAAQLFRGPEERAGVATQAHARIDEPVQVLTREIPEDRADHTALDDDVRVHRVRIGREPRALDDTLDLDVVAIVPARHERRVRNRTGFRKRSATELANLGRRDVRREPSANRASFELDEVAGTQLRPPAAARASVRQRDPLAKLAVVHDQLIRECLVVMRDDGRDAHRIAAGAFVLRQGADGFDGRQRRQRRGGACFLARRARRNANTDDQQRNRRPR